MPPRETAKRTLLTVDDLAGVQLPDWCVCPICGAEVVLEEVTGWEQRPDGTWRASKIHIQCSTEPSIYSVMWGMWYVSHWSMPYVDWLPLTERLICWLVQRYDWSIE